MSTDLESTMMDRCDFCGGSVRQSTQIHEVRGGEDVVTYPRYARKCMQCGREERDDHLRNANKTAALIAKSMFLGIRDGKA
jgi:hypothetical protein